MLCLVGLFSGIAGIKDRAIRGRSIATTAVSAIGLLLGFIFLIYGFFMLAMVSSLG